jgi:hypothetical protein
MTSERGLAYLAKRLAVSEENLATEALTRLLARSAAARGAMLSVSLHAGALPDSLSFIGQVRPEDLERPDVVGSDPSTRERT